MISKQKILIVDDDNNIAELVSLYLTKECYETMIVNDGESVKGALESFAPNLILLDLMLPGMDGYQVCREVRAESRIPIIMLSAKGEIFDKVLGLELGADDYITKPFSVREVMARVKANLRKTEKYDKPGRMGDNNPEIKFGALSLDVDKYEVRVNEKNVDLTLREFELLKFLATQRGQVFSREELLEKVWGYEYFGDVRTVDVTVRRIREKIEPNPSVPEFLATKRGIGYYFNGQENN